MSNDVYRRRHQQFEDIERAERLAGVADVRELVTQLEEYLRGARSRVIRPGGRQDDAHGQNNHMHELSNLTRAPHHSERLLAVVESMIQEYVPPMRDR